MVKFHLKIVCALLLSFSLSLVASEIVEDGNGDFHYATGSAPEIEFVAENPEEDELPLGLCQGDCDDDDDCVEGLVCYKRDAPYQTIPGCSGGDEDFTDFDYCALPAAIADDSSGNEAESEPTNGGQSSSGSQSNAGGEENNAAAENSNEMAANATSNGAAQGVQDETTNEDGSNPGNDTEEDQEEEPFYQDPNDPWQFLHSVK